MRWRFIVFALGVALLALSAFTATRSYNDDVTFEMYPDGAERPLVPETETRTFHCAAPIRKQATYLESMTAGHRLEEICDGRGARTGRAQFLGVLGIAAIVASLTGLGMSGRVRREVARPRSLPTTALTMTAVSGGVMVLLGFAWSSQLWFVFGLLLGAGSAVTLALLHAPPSGEDRA